METDFREILKEIRKGYYRCIGLGSGRIVFDLGNGNVIKIAKNIRGKVQNQAESEIFTKEPNELFAKVIQVSDNFKLLIMEKAERLKNMSFVLKYFSVENYRELKKVKELVDISEKYNLLLSDFGRSENWGKINEKPVIVDYGFTKSVAYRYYNH